MSKDTYFLGALITGVISVIVLWLYAISSWGLLLGLALGWIPALIGGLVLGFIWPVIAALFVLAVAYYLLQNR